MIVPPFSSASRFFLSAAGFIATSTFGWSPGVRMSREAKWIWNADTPASVPAGGRVSGGKSGNGTRAVPSIAVASVKRLPTSCMPSPESPANRTTTRSLSWTAFVTRKRDQRRLLRVGAIVRTGAVSAQAFACAPGYDPCGKRPSVRFTVAWGNHDLHRDSLHQVGRDSSHFGWDNSIAPVLEIDSGEVVELEVRDASGGQLDRDSQLEAVAALDFSRVNPVTGPVFVKGARPGDVLAVDILELRPRDWGWTAIIPGFGLLADEFGEPWLRISEVDASAGRVRFGDGVLLPYDPFPGTIGVAPAEPGEHSIVPPRKWGGNMDTRHLRAGTTLFLPVGVEGALFSVGDTHAAMGDGEVCGTAVEAPMDITVRLSVRRDLSIDAPQFVVPAAAAPPERRTGFHVCTGVGPDLWEATRDATRSLVEHMVEQRGRTREEAYAIASVAADLRIHEVVDAPNWVVGAFLPLDIFEEEEGG